MVISSEPKKGGNAMTAMNVGNCYPVTVNYDLIVEDAVRQGRYDWVNDGINTSNFPTNRTGRADLKIEPVHFDRIISESEVLREFARMRRRPAELRELLAFGIKYPGIQLHFPIIALDYVRPCLLYALGAKRYLDMDLTGFDWRKFCRFAGVLIR